tara:strand:+ start:158 stop:274 length:117 start_codon:yes stop_codon:yes gene_type:complete
MAGFSGAVSVRGLEPPANLGFQTWLLPKPVDAHQFDRP